MEERAEEDDSPSEALLLDLDADRLRARLRRVVTLRRPSGKQRQAGYSFS